MQLDVQMLNWQKWRRRPKLSSAPVETIPFTKILTNGQNAPKLSPMSLVVWGAGEAAGRNSRQQTVARQDFTPSA